MSYVDPWAERQIETFKMLLPEQEIDDGLYILVLEHSQTVAG